MIYFKDVRTLEELKSEYHRLCMAHHPDRGGSTEAMQIVNAEYAELFQMVKDKHANKDGKTYTRSTEEAPEAFQNLIEALLRLNGIKISIIGSFVWVEGNTKLHKDVLKGLGFRWHSKKQCWFLSPVGYQRRGRQEYSMEEIRRMYGVRYSEDVNLKELTSA